MKKVGFWILLLLPLIILSCSTSKNKQDGGLVNAAAILSYKDSLDNNLAALTEQKSLPYSVGDYTFTITKYSGDHQSVLFIEQGKSLKYGIREKRFYLKNRKLVLYTERAEIATNEAEKPGFLEKRAFYNNGQQFGAAERNTSGDNNLKQSIFEDTKPLLVNVKRLIRMYDQALNQTGQFDLSFDAIIEYPKAKYIVLGHPRLKFYRSALLILKPDHLVNELLNNPLDYRGRKLKMRWAKKNNEYVYLSGRLK